MSDLLAELAAAHEERETLQEAAALAAEHEMELIRMVVGEHGHVAARTVTGYSLVHIVCILGHHEEVGESKYW